MSISAFARTTGVPAETLRSWERRYGQPVPVRLPSGHRRYLEKDVERIRIVAALIEGGMRPSELLEATLAELKAAAPSRSPLNPEVEAWLSMAAEFKAGSLRAALRQSMQAMEALPFLLERVTPFLVQVGEAWESGQWTVGQEHSATEVVHEVLHELVSSVRAAWSQDSPARVLIAGLPGETHGLVVQMLEVVSREAGADVWSLGVNCPIESFAQAAQATRATHILTHISAANAGIKADQSLRDLLELLAREVDSEATSQPVELIVGGSGALRSRRGVRGVTYLNDLTELRRRLSTWTPQPM